MRITSPGRMPVSLWSWTIARTGGVSWGGGRQGGPRRLDRFAGAGRDRALPPAPPPAGAQRGHGLEPVVDIGGDEFRLDGPLERPADLAEPGLDRAPALARLDHGGAD